MTAVASLRLARERLSQPGAWLPCSFSARDVAGRDVWVMSREAVTFGVLGALSAVGTNPRDRQAIMDALRSVTGAKFLCDWTAAEGRSQAEVLDAIDRAAAKLEEDRWGAAA